MNTWATDLATVLMKGGREVLRILTRPWSEDSSTPIRKERETDSEEQPNNNQSRQQQEKANNTTTNQTNQTKRGKRGAGVEKPDTSLARQFKHPEHK